MSMTGKIAVVTGGSRGIGRAVCLELARRGANVVFSYAGNAAAAQETLKQLEALGVQARAVQGDVSDPAAALSPVTPGELLKEEFLVPMGISQYRLAKETGIPAQRIGQIVLGRRSITADTDLRLCRFLGLSDGYWLRAQAAYDIEVARRKLEPELKKIVPLSRVAASL